MSHKVIIIGAGEAGQMVVREIHTHPQSGLDVVGFLDDDESLHGRRIEGRPVFGACSELPRITQEQGIEEAIIAVPSGSRDVIRKVIALCRDADVSFKIVPGLIEIIKGPVHLEQIREVHADDLLGRQSVEFDEDAIQRELAGKRVMVTGAGGSIGGEICRQLGRFDLAELQLLGRGENQIYNIEEEMRQRYPKLELHSVICDIRDRSGLAETMKRYKPDFVYHAAAHKHVHYMEAFPEEAVKNNIFGTANVIDAARKANVGRLVMLSTDKAVKPHGVMGATKRFAEYLMIAAAASGDGPRTITVRFGNVLGSRGSVVPLFIRQIRAGGPVTVSSSDASRFFMTLKEACMLVVQASLMGKGGEIFVLQMGSPIKIMEIAKDLIALHGLRPEDDVKIEVVGLRPGEKLNEDLVAPGEEVKDSPHDYILNSMSRIPDGLDLQESVEKLKKMTKENNGAGIRQLLDDVIPDADLNQAKPSTSNLGDPA